jgi:hypothetical protein
MSHKMRIYVPFTLKHETRLCVNFGHYMGQMTNRGSEHFLPESLAWHTLLLDATLFTWLVLSEPMPRHNVQLQYTRFML